MTCHLDGLLAAARARLERVEPQDLAAAVAAGDLVVDIRPEANRREEGEMPGAIVIERTVLEWRLDPTGDHAIAAAREGRRVVLVCNEGFASVLAAVSLQDLGLADATDLAGGYRAWREQVASMGAAPTPRA